VPVLVNLLRIGVQNGQKVLAKNLEAFHLRSENVMVTVGNLTHCIAAISLPTKCTNKNYHLRFATGFSENS
jgi:riboflavin transporter FmnP